MYHPLKVIITLLYEILTLGHEGSHKLTAQGF